MAGAADFVRCAGETANGFLDGLTQRFLEVGGGGIRFFRGAAQKIVDFRKRGLDTAAQAVHQLVGVFLRVGERAFDRAAGILTGGEQGAPHGLCRRAGALFGLVERAADIGEGRLQIVTQIAGDILRTLFGFVERGFHDADDVAHGAFDFLGALDKADGQAAQRILAFLQRADKARLCGIEKFGCLAQHLRMFFEASDDTGNLRQRLAGNIRQAVDLSFEQTAGAGHHVGGLRGGFGEAGRRGVQCLICRAEALCGALNGGIEVGCRLFNDLGHAVMGLRQHVRALAGGGDQLVGGIAAGAGIFVDALFDGVRHSSMGLGQHIRALAGGCDELARRIRSGSGIVTDRLFHHADHAAVALREKLGALLGGGNDLLGGFAADGGIFVDDRLGFLLDQARQLRRAAGQHRVEFAGAVVQRRADGFAARVEGRFDTRQRFGNDTDLRADDGFSLGNLVDDNVACLGEGLGHGGGLAGETGLRIRDAVNDLAGALFDGLGEGFVLRLHLFCKFRTGFREQGG
ncbi:hypothetical protein D3C87_792100 [compost metagenome]